MAQPPTPAAKPAEKADHRPVERPSSPVAHATKPDPKTPPFGAPAVMRRDTLVAVGTVIHQDKDGKRTIIDHGQPIPEGIETKTLVKQGAAARTVPITPAPGVEAKEAPEWHFDEKRGVWVDEQGSVHAPVMKSVDDRGH